MFNGLSLCSGIDSIGLGLTLISPCYRTVCHVEREVYSAAILATRMVEGFLAPAPIWDDVTTFDGRPWRGQVDIITSGFPCQPWSTMGARKGKDDKRWIWPNISRVIHECRPSIVFLENVPTLYPVGFDDIRRDLTRQGYIIERPVLAEGFHVGAKQKRRRLFIMAHDDNEGRELLAQIINDYWAGPCGYDVDGYSTENVCNDSDFGSQEPGRHARYYLQGHRTPWSPDRNISAWQDIPTWLWPGLPKSAIRGVAHGPSDHVEQCRAIGNGCIPSVVALAFMELAMRVVGTERKEGA